MDMIYFDGYEVKRLKSGKVVLKYDVEYKLVNKELYRVNENNEWRKINVRHNVL